MFLRALSGIFQAHRRGNRRCWGLAQMSHARCDKSSGQKSSVRGQRRRSVYRNRALTIRRNLQPRYHVGVLARQIAITFAVKRYIKGMQYAFAGFARNKFAYEQVVRPGSFVTQHSILLIVGIYDVEIFAEAVNGAQFIQNYSPGLFQHLWRYFLAVLIVSVHIVLVRILLWLASVQRNK